MPIVQRPLAAVIARGDGGVRRPRDLEGHTVGVTGLPSDEAVVDSEVSADGGDPAEVDEVTIGFNAVSSLAAGKVDAATGFWNAEGVALQRQGVPIRIFKVDRLRRPALPRAGPHHLAQDARQRPGPGRRGRRRDPPRLRLRRARTRPRRSTTCSPPTRPSTAPNRRRSCRRLLPDLHPAPFDPRVLRDWAAWDLEHGLLDSGPLDVDGSAFDLAERPRASRQLSSRSTSCGSSRAIRERGTTRSTPAASAAARVSTSTCE